MFIAFWLSVVVVMSPSEMFMTLNQLKELNSKNPQHAAQVFRTVKSRLPKKPSRGLLDLYLAGLEAGVRVNDADVVQHIVAVLESDPWKETVEGAELDIVTAVAIYHRRIHDYAYAEILNECAISYAADPKEFARVANNMAVVYRYSGQPAKAQNILNESLMLAEDREIVANIKNNLGNIYFDQKKYRHAQLMYIRAFRYHSEVGQSGYAAGTGLNLLNTQIFLGDWPSFERYRSSVALEVKQSGQDMFKFFFMWQTYLNEHLNYDTPLSEKRISTLIDTIPLLLKSELGPSLAYYSSLFQNDRLRSTLLSQLEKTPDIKSVQEPNGIRVKLERLCTTRIIAKNHYFNR
ncbi:tetratricopeptide repeat protein [Pseudoalteromonas luteoviolacea]|uniref:tetratricopeptide repeat protein n=1 Tax=Pseudoalteromonas luteoviolacea TaxID=43657 RepID=UPI001F3749C2|nr:tetratricopeptide repeat protein [Pseudoalteromonas luteoviolacea]MCF6442584.1 tetratricopeptide repeat protein [Pseudoalteromonas luteoviolacea]